MVKGGPATGDDAKLREILSCYFHQDWPDEGEEYEVVQLILSEYSKDEIASAANEIDRLMALDLSENEALDMLIRQYGCYLHPPGLGLTYYSWLASLRDRFRSFVQGLTTLV